MGQIIVRRGGGNDQNAINNAGQTAEWGKVTGDITQQGDLQSALDDKYDKTGGTISGETAVSYNDGGIAQFILEGGANNYKQTFRNGNGFLEWMFGNQTDEDAYFSIRLENNVREMNGKNGPTHLVNNATGSSGGFNAISVLPTVNQSGTAGYTALRINPTETATGSGPKLLADMQVGGASKFSVANDGVVTASNRITNVTDPTDAQDAATKNYVDNLISPAQRTALDALDTSTSTVADIINALQAT